MWSLGPILPLAIFSIKSCYRVLSGGPVISKFKPIWEARVPPKIRFPCGMLSTADQIKKRHDLGSEFCAFLWLP